MILYFAISRNLKQQVLMYFQFCFSGRGSSSNYSDDQDEDMPEAKNESKHDYNNKTTTTTTNTHEPPHLQQQQQQQHYMTSSAATTMTSSTTTTSTPTSIVTGTNRQVAPKPVNPAPALNPVSQPVLSDSKIKLSTKNLDSSEKKRGPGRPPGSTKQNLEQQKTSTVQQSNNGDLKGK